MPDLPPATASQRLLSQAVPKRLLVRFRCKESAERGVLFTPVFTVDNLTVSADLITAVDEQTILGYRVVASPVVQRIIETTSGRPRLLTKGAAADYAQLLFERGIQVISDSGQLVGPGRSARVVVDLTLLPGDRLEVKTHLALDDGTIVPKPVDLQEVLADHGWMPVGKEMVKLPLTKTRLDHVLLESDGDGILAGSLVPEFLKSVQTHRSLLPELRLDPSLQRLTVVEGQARNVLHVSGAEDGVRVEATLVVVVPDGTVYRCADDEIMALSITSRSYVRHDGGWIEIDKKSIAAYQRARRQLTIPLGIVGGAGIPQALVSLQSIVANAWACEIDPAVRRDHRTLEVTPTIRFTLQPRAEEGALRYRLEPTYDFRGVTVGHAECVSVLAASDPWVRVDDAWVRPSREAVASVEAFARDEQLLPSGRGYEVPAGRWQAVAAAAERLGVVHFPLDAGTHLRLDIDLRLAEHNAVDVTAVLRLSDGHDLAIPPDIEAARQHNGWCVSDGRLLRIPAFEPAIDALLSQGGRNTIRGSEIPAFLAVIDRQGDALGVVRRDDALARCVVKPVTVSHHIRARGDGDEITLVSSLVLTTQAGDTAEIAFGTLEEAGVTSGSYLRVSWGWAELPPDALERFFAARRALEERCPLDKVIRGSRIPETVVFLQRLAQCGGVGGGWRVFVAHHVAVQHATIETPGAPEFTLQLGIDDGIPQASLVIVYRCGDGVLPHEVVKDHTPSDSRWVRYGERWWAVDCRSVRAVLEECERLGLYDVGASYRVPFGELPTVESRLALLGPVLRIPERIPEVSLDVELTAVGDAVVITSRLMDAEGHEYPKPVSLEELCDNGGYFAAGNALAHCQLHDNQLTRLLLARSGPATVRGDAVPNLLLSLQGSVHGVGQVKRDSRVGIVENDVGSVSQRLVIDGDDDSIRVDLNHDVRLVSGESRAVTDANLNAAMEAGSRFLRTATSWVAADRPFLQALTKRRGTIEKSVPLARNLVGAEIPTALMGIATLQAQGWLVSKSRAVSARHRCITSQATVSLQLARESGERRPRFTIKPSYLIDGVAVSHADAGTALQASGGWLRHGERWLRVDASLPAHVSKALEQCGFEVTESGFEVPPSARPVIAGDLSSVGPLHVLRADALGGGIEWQFSLTPDERLMARFRVILDDGTVLEPAVTFEELVADQGLVCHGKRLVEVPLPPDAPYGLLIAATNPAGLSGGDVPRCLMEIEKCKARFHNVVLEGALARLVVCPVRTRPELKVTGDADHLVIEPALMVVDADGNQTGESLKTSEIEAGYGSDGVFKRNTAGWWSVGAPDLAVFQSFVNDVHTHVSIGRRIEGSDVPRTLEKLAPDSVFGKILRTQFGIADTFVPEHISHHHRVIDRKAEPQFVLSVVPRGDRPSCTLDVRYVHGNAVLSHDQVQRCVAANDDRVRTPHGWVVVDSNAFSQIESMTRRLELKSVASGCEVPMRERARVRSALSGLGQVFEIPAQPVRASIVVDLRLDDLDNLHVASHIATEDGTIISTPNDVAALLDDDCCAIEGDRVVVIPAAETPLGRRFLDGLVSKQLDGQAVPRFLHHVKESEVAGFDFHRNQRLQHTELIEGLASPVIEVSTHATGIQLTPLVHFEPCSGEAIDIPDEGVPVEGESASDEESHEYVRVARGWVAIHRAEIQSYREAKAGLGKSFPAGLTIVGSDVPEALITLKEIDAAPKAASPWNVYFLDNVHEQHRLVTGAAAVSFTLDVLDSGGQSLLHLDPSYDHERFRFNHREVAGFVDSATRWVRRGNSWIEIDTESYERVDRQLEELGLEPRDEGFVFPATARERVLPLFTAIGTVEYTQAYGDFIAKLADFTSIDEVPLPANLRKDVILREYQQHGFNWLAFLQRFGLNGILADDMGLGKTLQTLAVVERAREVTGSGNPVLIICPASVVHNWRSEIERFLVDSTVVVFQGTARDHSGRRLDAMARGTVRPERRTYVVTSYDIVHREIDRLRAIPWLYVVCDEGHHIKNPSAKRSRLVKAIAGQHKLVLTGTPIQNGLVELWSLFDFAMPGYLGSQTEFTKKYCGGGGGPAWQALRDELATRIRPFVLRRLKTDVAKDLPEKLVIHHEVELTPIQVDLYKRYLESAEFRRLLSEIDSQGVRRSQTHIFTILHKLRNICNHPILASEDWRLEDARAEDSAKLDYLQELLEEVREGGHRALLFCRSTRMHLILKKFLQQWDYHYCSLDGQTPTDERQRLVEQFNSTPSITVFLLSMAGNTGINLTGADTVIFYDHDWNPANDNQAMDRAYRIGQTKTVTVYRLLSRGTIEERILERQRIKQTLADEVIGSDTAGFKDLSREEILALFRLDE